MQQPRLVKDYNKNMKLNGVDLSDQLIGKYNSLRKTNKRWKTLFFHFLDIARVISYILINEFRKRNPEIKELHRPVSYSQSDFTLELIRQLAGIEENEEVPVFVNSSTEMERNHPIKPFVTSKRGNCRLCCIRFKKRN